MSVLTHCTVVPAVMIVLLRLAFRGSWKPQQSALTMCTCARAGTASAHSMTATVKDLATNFICRYSWGRFPAPEEGAYHPERSGGESSAVRVPRRRSSGPDEHLPYE